MHNPTIDNRGLANRAASNTGISNRGTGQALSGQTGTLIAREPLKLKEFEQSSGGWINMFIFNQPIDEEIAFKYLFRYRYVKGKRPRNPKQAAFYDLITRLNEDDFNIRITQSSKELRIRGDIYELLPYFKPEIRAGIEKKIPPPSLGKETTKTQPKAKPQAREQGTSLFLYYPSVESGMERYEREPEEGPFQRTAEYKDLSHLVGLAKEFAKTEGLISRLGILAHGGRDVGTYLLGSTKLSYANISKFQNVIRSLSECLTRDAIVLMLGCNAGADAKGSIFLKDWSVYLQPGRAVVGFPVLTTSRIKPGGINNNKMELVITTTARTDVGGQVYESLKKYKDIPADEKHPLAKIAKDGKISEWPANEVQHKERIEKEEWRIRKAE